MSKDKQMRPDANEVKRNTRNKDESRSTSIENVEIGKEFAVEKKDNKKKK
ncbi:MAG: hypothetical protein QME46_00985 [Thermoanaerobacteraceae bacterium]|nr:hypothetical protein [Thermoanaerobacteraceae bacterium]